MDALLDPTMAWPNYGLDLTIGLNPKVHTNFGVQPNNLVNPIVRSNNAYFQLQSSYEL